MVKTFKSFTLFEVIIVLGLVVIFSMVVIPISISQVRSNKVESAMLDMKSLVQVVQQNSYTKKNNNSYGVKFNADSFVIFEGYSFDSSTNKETIKLEPGLRIENINISGGTSEIFFPSGSLQPNNEGSIDLSDGEKVFRLIINSEGLISYNQL